MPLNIQKEWSKIEGRFNESSFFDRNTNHYMMIGTVFEKTLKDTNKKLNIQWASYIETLFKRFQNGKIGLGTLLLQKNAKETIKKCYPLNPVVLALLPVLSQKVAQNERTLCTFLTRDEDNSLYRFINLGLFKSKLQLLGFSKLYEYFSPLIAKDTGIGGNYKIQLMYEEACNIFTKEDILAKEIISLTALLSIVKDAHFAPLSEEFIVACLSDIYHPKEIKEKINVFIIKKVLSFNKIFNQFELVEGSSVDIDEEINKLKQCKLTSKDLVKLLKNYIKPSYVIPNRYNFKHYITRYFKGDIISFEELFKISPDLRPNYRKEDGIIYYVIPFSKDELDQSRAVIRNSKNECIAFILPETFIECDADLEELNAINALFANKEVINSGPLVSKELNRHKDILIKSIEKIVNVVLGKTFLKARCFYPRLDREISVRHFSQLNRFLGDILEEEYNYSIGFQI